MRLLAVRLAERPSRRRRRRLVRPAPGHGPWRCPADSGHGASGSRGPSGPDRRHPGRDGHSRGGAGPRERRRRGIVAGPLSACPRRLAYARAVGVRMRSAPWPAGRSLAAGRVLEAPAAGWSVTPAPAFAQSSGRPRPIGHAARRPPGRGRACPRPRPPARTRRRRAASGERRARRGRIGGMEAGAAIASRQGCRRPGRLPPDASPARTRAAVPAPARRDRRRTRMGCPRMSAPGGGIPHADGADRLSREAARAAVARFRAGHRAPGTARGRKTAVPGELGRAAGYDGRRHPGRMPDAGPARRGGPRAGRASTAGRSRTRSGASASCPAASTAKRRGRPSRTCCACASCTAAANSAARPARSSAGRRPAPSGAASPGGRRTTTRGPAAPRAPTASGRRSRSAGSASGPGCGRASCRPAACCRAAAGPKGSTSPCSRRWMSAPGGPGPRRCRGTAGARS